MHRNQDQTTENKKYCQDRFIEIQKNPIQILPMHRNPGQFVEIIAYAWTFRRIHKNEGQPEKSKPNHRHQDQYEEIKKSIYINQDQTEEIKSNV